MLHDVLGTEEKRVLMRVLNITLCGEGILFAEQCYTNRRIL
jgi:hypothetical protein